MFSCAVRKKPVRVGPGQGLFPEPLLGDEVVEADGAAAQRVGHQAVDGDRYANVTADAKATSGQHGDGDARDEDADALDENAPQH